MTIDIHINDRRRIDVSLAEALGSGLDGPSRSVVATLWKTSVLPSIEENARRQGMDDPQRLDQLQRAGRLTRALFEALHREAEARSSGPAAHAAFWEHQSATTRGSRMSAAGMSIDKSALQEIAVEYLRHPEVRSNKLDWVLLDALVFHELQAQGSDMRTFLRLATLINALKAVAVYVLAPALVYLLWARGQQTLAVAAGVFGSIAVLIHLVGAPFRWRDLDRGRTFLGLLQDLYGLLGQRTLSPVELRAAVDRATAAGVRIDRVVVSLVDRMAAADATAFHPEQVTAGSPVRPAEPGRA